MKTVAELYESFGRAGFLSPAVWTAQPIGTPIPGDVRHRKPTTEVLGDGGAIVFDPVAQFPAVQFAGIKRGDRLDVATEAGTLAYRIRELHAIGNGDETRATLAAWS
jgi:hypothetical protein